MPRAALASSTIVVRLLPVQDEANRRRRLLDHGVEQKTLARRNKIAV